MNRIEWSLDVPSGDRSITAIHAALLAIALGAYAYLTIAIPYPHVFGPGFTNFQGHDSWYHVRLIEYAAHNFPRTLHEDPYLQPGGDRVPTGPLFDWLVAGVARARCGDGPADAGLESAAAFASPLLGTLTILVVFGIGRRLFGATAGVAAAALLATMPSPFLERTLLGVADHHSAEVLFSSLTTLGFIRALDVQASRRINAAAAGAGVALGAYLLAWTSGALFVAILASWVAVLYVVAPTTAAFARAARIMGIATAVAFACVAAFEDSRTPLYGVQLLALAATGVGVTGLAIAQRLAARARFPRLMLAAAPFVIAVVAAGAAWLVSPPLVDDIHLSVQRLLPREYVAAGEARSMLAQGGVTFMLWTMFGTGLAAALPAAIVLAIALWRRRSPELALLMAWTATMFAATMAQVRFGYYLAIPIALLGGCSIAMVSRLIRSANLQAAAAGTLVILLCLPNLPAATFRARLDWGMPQPWQAAFHWMRGNTPEPFGDPDRYFAEPSTAPRPAYAVMNWWDHGYWILRQARRVPIATPRQIGGDLAAQFYTETDPSAAAALLRDAAVRYVLAGEEIPLHFDNVGGIYLSWFSGMLEWLQVPQAKFVEPLSQVAPDGAVNPVFVYYHAFYESMAHRLYFFGSASVTPASAWVVSIGERTNAAGDTERYATNLQEFTTYADAQAEAVNRGAGEHRVVGLDPLRSPVPLAPVPGMRVVYDSPERAPAFPGTPAARIFEFTK